MSTATRRGAIALWLLALLSSGPESSLAEAAQPWNLRHAWFKPMLEVDRDELCPSILKNAQRVFETSEEFGAAMAEPDALRGLVLVRPWEAESLSSDTAVSKVDAYFRRLKIVEPDGSTFWIEYHTNPGCGGACESYWVSAAKQPPIAGASTNRDDEETGSGSARKGWSLLRSQSGVHYFVGVVDGEIRVYSLENLSRVQLSCRIWVSPDVMGDDADPAVKAMLPALNTLHETVRALTGEPGNCGSMATPWRWDKAVEDSLRVALYRPWSLTGLAFPTADSNGDYSIYGAELGLWSLGGLYEHDALDRYARGLDRATTTLGQFYRKKFRWSVEQSRSNARAALTAAINNGMRFYEYEPYPASNEAELRKAILEHRGIAELRSLPVEKETYSRVLDAAVRDPDALAFLLEAGADPNWQNAFGKTALMYAAQYDQDDSAQTLLAHGADPNAATIRPSDDCNYTLKTIGMTPLHYAVRYASAKLVRRLLAAGALPFNEARQEFGAEKGYPLDWLRRYGGDVESERNPNLSEADVQSLAAMLQVPSDAERKALSVEFTRRAEADYSAGSAEKAYRGLMAAVSADPSNAVAMTDLQLIALRTGRQGLSLEIGNRLLEMLDDPKLQGNVWFNLGLACDGERYVTYGGEFYCKEDPIQTFLTAWRLGPSGARADKLRDLMSASTRTICAQSTGVRYRFEYDVVSGQPQRIYVLHPRGQQVNPSQVSWPTGSKGGTAAPALVSRDDLGDFSITTLESNSVAYGVVTVGDSVCRPYN